MLNESSIQGIAGYRNVPVDKVVPCITFADFDEWTNHGAERRKVAQALAENWAFRNDSDRALAEAWLRQAETAAAVKAAEQAAVGAMWSARWTLVAAVAAMLGALFSFGQAWITARSDRAGSTAQSAAAVPTQAVPTAGTSPQPSPAAAPRPSSPR